MDATLTVITHGLILMLVTTILVGIYLTTRSKGSFLAWLAADPTARSRFYRRFIISSSITAAFVPLIALTSADLSAAGLGWTWPNGDGLDYLVASSLMVSMVVGGIRGRRLMRRGGTMPARARVSPMIPRTGPERRLAAAVALAAGITEEMVFRGLFIAAGTQLYHLPLALAALVSLALFVATHAYQGRRSLVGIAFLGCVFTGVYLFSGSLLLAIAVHVCQDLVALLVVPAEPTAQPAPAPALAPAENDRVEPPTTPEQSVAQPVTAPVLRSALPH